MENHPLVSVLVQTYNSQEVISETLDSILQQEYSNIEIVVCDDGSTDGTPTILKKYRSKHPNIKLTINERNLGITKTSNIALAQCTGKYIAFIGGDDIFFPEKIRMQVEFMEQNPDVTMSYHNVDVFDRLTNTSLYLYGAVIPPQEGDASTVIRYGCFFCACSVMLRSDKLPAGGYEESFPVASDWHFMMHVLLQGGRIAYINKVLGKYIRHGSNVTNEDSPLRAQALLDTLNVFHWLLLRYPKYKKDAFYWYSMQWRGFRKNKKIDSYLKCLLISLSFRFNVKALLGVLVYVISLGMVRL